MTLFKYDGFDRLYKIIYPDETYEQFGYDKNSNVTNWRVRDGNTIYYEYNALNRLTEKKVADWPSIKFGYDIMGRVVEVNDLRDVNEGGGITGIKYDRLGRVEEVNDIYGRVIEYEYDQRGLRTKIDYAAGFLYDVRYEYDALGRVRKVKRLGVVLAEYEYDELGRRTQLSYYNNANIMYDYDIANQLRSVKNNINLTTDIDFEYPRYDKVGNRLSMKVDDDPNQLYEYDSLYQLCYVDYNDGNTTRYHYDDLGNRVDVNENGSLTDYYGNNMNQYTQVDTTNFTYDDAGNLTFDGQFRYYYDSENRLTDVNDSSDDPVASYKYDFAGRRVKKITYDAYGQPDEAITYQYDGWQVIAEYDAETSSCLRRFYYGPWIDEPVMMINVSTYARHYYHYDGLGNVIALSDNSGNLVERYSYDVFGEPNRTSAIGNPYMFTGRRLDEETGLYYYRYRYYSPETGRFLQTDPLGYYSGFNLYAYCLNNPVYWIDPLGLRHYEPWEVEYMKFSGRLRWHWWYHAPRGLYDFKHWNYGDTFFVYGRGVMSASEFGNYMAGYMSSYHWGTLAYGGVRAAGHADALFENGYLAANGLDPEYLLDDPESIRDLRRGREDALADWQQGFDEKCHDSIADPVDVPPVIPLSS